MFEIYLRNLDRFGYVLDERAQLRLKFIIEDAVAHKDKHFGNARFVRNIFEQTLENQAQRLCLVADPTIEQISTLTESDLPE